MWGSYCMGQFWQSSPKIWPSLNRYSHRRRLNKEGGEKKRGEEKKRGFIVDLTITSTICTHTTGGGEPHLEMVFPKSCVVEQGRGGGKKRESRQLQWNAG